MRFPLIRNFPLATNFRFVRWRYYAFAASIALGIASIILVAVHGLNFGIDFRGGTLIEIRTESRADLAKLRSQVEALGLGDVQLQQFGDENSVLIRVEQQRGDASQQSVVARIKEALGSGVTYNRVEVVGPKVSGELINTGIFGVGLAILMMLIYIWFRFEWQFGIGSVVALTHDVVLTLGIFSLLDLQFDLSIIAAILTIMGYSMND